MDLTSKLALACSLSKWTGEYNKCRKCNRVLSGRSRVWCSKKCKRVWDQNHLYRKARSECRRLSRKPCPCPRVRSHPTCAHCGKCQGVLLESGSRLECNHRVPLLGGYRTITCANHLINLEMLCRTCHLSVTRQQRVTYKK